MRKILIASLFAAGLVTTTLIAHAQSAPAESDQMKAAIEVEHAMGGEAALNQSFKAMRPGLIAFMTSQNHIPIGRAAELVDTVLLPALQAHSAELLAARAQSLAKHFTIAELAEIKQFYLSPAGQKLLANQAAIATEAMQSMQPLMRDVISRTIAMHKNKAAASEKQP